MNPIEQRNRIFDIAEAYARPQERDVYERLRSIIGDDGTILTIIGDDGTIYNDLDLLQKHNELRTNKQFALNFLKIYPRGYQYLSQDLQNDIDILFAIAKAPIFYDKRKYPSSDELRAICPLEVIVDKYIRRIFNKEPKFSVIEIAKEDPYMRFRISSFRALILNAIRSELDSYEYIKMMENTNNTCGYSGLKLQDRIRRGDKIDFEEFNDLLSMQYAPEELKNDKEFRKEVERIAQSYIEKTNSTKSIVEEGGR